MLQQCLILRHASGIRRTGFQQQQNRNGLLRHPCFLPHQKLSGMRRGTPCNLFQRISRCIFPNSCHLTGICKPAAARLDGAHVLCQKPGQNQTGFCIAPGQYSYSFSGIRSTQRKAHRSQQIGGNQNHVLHLINPPFFTGDIPDAADLCLTAQRKKTGHESGIVSYGAMRLRKIQPLWKRQLRLQPRHWQEFGIHNGFRKRQCIPFLCLGFRKLTGIRQPFQPITAVQTDFSQGGE